MLQLLGQQMGLAALLATLAYCTPLAVAPTSPAKPNERSNRLEILRLIEDGTLSPDEGLRMIEAMDDADREPGTASVQATSDESHQRGSRIARLADTWIPSAQSSQPRGRGRTFRILVSNEDGKHVNLALPIGLVDAGLRIVQNIAPQFLQDREGIRMAITQAEPGTIVEVNDGEDYVKISID